MNKKIAVFSVCLLLVMTSAGAWFLTKESDEDVYVTTGQYDVWVTTAETKPTSAAVTAASTTLVLSEAPPETETEFLYINLNTASKEELMRLDGIGEVTAENIAGYRAYSGGFRNIEEIMNVKGVGEKKFEAIKPHIYVENPVYPEETQAQPATKAPPAEEVTETEYTEPFRYDLNTVTFEELMTLPGMKEDTALNILRLREDIGGFSHPYELLYAEGVSEKYLSEIMDYIYV